MDPIAGLLSPQDRRRSRNLGLLSAGLSLMADSGWSTEPQDTLSNVARAGLTGLQAYMGSNERALEMQQYRQAQLAQQQEQERLKQQEQNLRNIVQNIGAQGTFGTRAQRQAWVAWASSGGVEQMQEAIEDYQKSLNPEAQVVGGDSRLVRAGPEGAQTLVEPTPEPKGKWYDALPSDARLAAATVLGVPDLDSADPAAVAGLDMNRVWQMVNQKARSGADTVTIQNLPEAAQDAATTAIAEMTGESVTNLGNYMQEVQDAMNYADLSMQVPGEVISGAFADERLFLAKLADLTGISSDQLKADISKSELTRSVLGQRLFNILASGALGSGSGISDKDMETAADIAQAGLDTTERGRIQTMYFAGAMKIGQIYETIDRMQQLGTITQEQANMLRAEAKVRVGDLNDLRRKFAGVKIDGQLVLPHLQEDLTAWEQGIQIRTPQEARDAARRALGIG